MIEDHGMLFRAPLVRALVDGRKDVTRRPITRRNATDIMGKTIPEELWNTGKLVVDRAYLFGVALQRGAVCMALHPRIFSGDRIWVRETCKLRALARVERTISGRVYGLRVRYAADGAERDVYPAPGSGTLLEKAMASPEWVPVPSLLMPRVASRFLLPVVHVSAERVDQITPMEVFREGYPFFAHSLEEEPYEPIESFQRLWNSIGDRETDAKGWGDGSTAVWRYEWSKPKILT